jgi:hypothetical protein
MTTNQLRHDLHDLAGEIDMVDLLDRSLSTSRRIARRRRIVAAAATAAAILAIAGTAFAVGPIGGPAPTPADGTQPASPSITASPSRPTAPSPSVQASPSLSGSERPAPTLAELGNATISVPTLDDCTGTRVFVNFVSPIPSVGDGRTSEAYLVSAVVGDLYRDGRSFTAALISCATGGPIHSSEILVLEWGTGATVLTRDVVAQSGVSGEIITNLRLTSDRRVEAEFTLTTVSPAQPVWRSFVWNGTVFVQAFGS